MNAFVLVVTLVVGIVILIAIQPKDSKSRDKGRRDGGRGDGGPWDSQLEDKTEDKIEEEGKKKLKKKSKKIKAAVTVDRGNDEKEVDNERVKDRIDVADHNNSLLKPQSSSAISLSSQLSSQSVEDEDGWIEVKKRKSSNTAPQSGQASSNRNIGNDLTKKQRENQKKAQKLKELKEIQRREQEERLKRHRSNQES